MMPALGRVRQLMTRYCSYYERSRTHLALDKDAPVCRPVMPAGDAPSSPFRLVGLVGRVGQVADCKSAASTIDTNGAQPDARRVTSRHSARCNEGKRPNVGLGYGTHAEVPLS
jgi:hypothetical protein